MSGGIIGAGVAPHTPRMGIEATAPDFVKAVIKGQYAMGEALRAARPDVIVINSAHWVCTFNWYVTCQNSHAGRCVSDEAPDLIPGIPYSYKGDPAYGAALVDEIKALGYPCHRNDSEYFKWDYGSWVPAHYLDPASEVPVVLVGTVVSADLEESMAVGTAVRRAAEKTGRRVAFFASCSFTHKLVRGPAALAERGAPGPRPQVHRHAERGPHQRGQALVPRIRPRRGWRDGRAQHRDHARLPRRGPVLQGPPVRALRPILGQRQRQPAARAGQLAPRLPREARPGYNRASRAGE